MKVRYLSAVLALGLFAGPSQAARFTVTIQNLTQGIYFTPLLVAAHDSATHLFQPGTAASASLQAMAEGGDLSGLSTDLATAGAVTETNPAGGLLAPGGAATTATLDTGSSANGYLSITGMMLPTNDGFVGLDAWPIPTTPGTYTVDLNAWDAGTEANNELINSANGGAPGTPGIPAAPGGDAGSNGTGVTTTETNGTVHIHRGVLGDTNPAGGVSDLDSRVHRWLNPVARVTVVVQ